MKKINLLLHLDIPNEKYQIVKEDLEKIGFRILKFKDYEIKTNFVGEFNSELKDDECIYSKKLEIAKILTKYNVHIHIQIALYTLETYVEYLNSMPFEEKKKILNN